MYIIENYLKCLIFTNNLYLGVAVILQIVLAFFIVYHKRQNVEDTERGNLYVLTLVGILILM